MKTVSCLMFVAAVFFGAAWLTAQITFEDVTASAGIGSSNSTHSIIINDYNNDLFNDILVLGNSSSVLYKNNQNNTFSSVANNILISGTNLAAQMADFDNDGDLDAVVTGEYSLPSIRLFRNDSSDIFTDVTATYGFSSIDTRFYSVAWIDYNKDGWVDMFCAGLATTSRLFRNNMGTNFTDVSDSAGLSSIQANARGIAVGDVDGNGYTDVYIPNSGMANSLFLNFNGLFTENASSMNVSFSSEDNYTAVFGDYDNDGDLDLLLGNSSYPYRLLRNDGITFSEESVNAGIYRGNGQATCATFTDFDNDGYLDIIAQVHSSSSSYRLVALYKNNGNGTFQDISAGTGLINEQQWSNTLAVGDINNDGLQDLFLGHVYTADHLYRNTTSSINHWIDIKLNGVLSNRTGFGAKIFLKSNSNRQLRCIGIGNGYSSQNSLVQHFGLGNATTIDSVIVYWPSGITHYYTNVSIIDTTLMLYEIDLADPKPVTNIFPYSDYASPNSVTLTWTDPTEFYNLNPLDTFVIDIYRDDVLLASIPKGVETYTENGLSDGQYCIYSLITRHIPTDSTSNVVISDGWYAGGHPVPAAPTNLTAVGYVNLARLTWSNPATQLDGTPLDDLAKIYIYRNDVLIDSIDQSVITDTVYYDHIPSLEMNYVYKVRAVDDEMPVNMSEFSNEALAPPAIMISDTVLTHTIDFGATDSSHFWIYNHGLSDLAFDIKERRNVFTFLKDKNQMDDAGTMERTDEISSCNVLSANRAPVSIRHSRIKNQSGTTDILSAGDYNAFGTDAYGGYFVKFDLTAPQYPYTIGNQYGLFIDAASFSKDGSVLYAIERSSTSLFGRIDTATGAFTQIATLPSGGWTDMTVDPTDGTIYAAFVDGSNNSYLYSISETGSPTLKGAVNGVNILIGLAADRNGNLFGYDIGGDNFFSINKSNGSATLIGPIGLDANYAQSLEFDLNENICYMAAYNNSNWEAELRTVNISTGATTLIGKIGAGYGVEICGLGIASTGLPWVDVRPAAGVIETGDSAKITVIWKGNITEKTIIPYDGYLSILSNDPLMPAQNIHLHLDVTIDVKDLSGIPANYNLHNNYPNPFNPTTTIRYDLKDAGKVTLKIYNILGQEVRSLVNKNETAGFKSVIWDGKDNAGRMVSSGLYIYRLEAGPFVKSHKMMLLK